MKKILSVSLVALLLICCMAINVFAADAATITVAEVEAKSGETVTVEVTANIKGFNAADMSLDFDKTALELVEVKKNSKYEDLAITTNEKNGYVGFHGLPTDVDGVLFTATFKVLAEEEGKYNVTLKIEGVYANNVEVAVSDPAGAVVIPHEHKYEIVEGSAVAAECGKPGKEADQKCSCGDVIEGKATDALEHKWGEWKVTKNPEIGVEGEQERVCELCGEKQTEKIPALEEEDNPPTGDSIVYIAVLGAMMMAAIVVTTKRYHA